MLLKGFLLVLLLVCVVEINAGIRVARSPQFGSFSSANAQASSGGRPPFGPGQFGRPGGPGFGGPGSGGSGFGGPGSGGPGFGGPGSGGPGFGGPGSAGPGFGGPGFGGPGSGPGNRPGSVTNISISKSISISSGNGGVAKSSAKSSSG